MNEVIHRALLAAILLCVADGNKPFIGIALGVLIWAAVDLFKSK